MRVLLKNNWYAPGGVLYEAKKGFITLPDNYDETLLPSSARILNDADEQRAPKRAPLEETPRLAGGAGGSFSEENAALRAEMEQMRTKMSKRSTSVDNSDEMKDLEDENKALREQVADLRKQQSTLANVNKSPTPQLSVAKEPKK
jgi:hypothetical protein